MDTKTLSITMQIELIQAKRRRLEAENDDQEQEQDDIAQYAHRIIRMRDGLVESDNINNNITRVGAVSV